MSLFNIYITKFFVLFLIVSLAGLSSIYDYQSFVTYIFIPMTFVFSLYLNGFKSYALSNRYSLFFLIIFSWSILLTFILPVDFTSAWKNISKLFGVLLCIFLTVEFLNNINYNFIQLFLNGYVIAFHLLAFFLLSGIGGGGNFDITSGEYINRSQFDLNANTYSYFSFFAIISSFYLIEIKGDVKSIVISIITTILGIYISFMTASRSGLLFTILLPGIYWIFIFDKIKINKIIKFISSSIIFILTTIKIYNVYLSSYIRRRVDNSMQTGDSRTELVKGAINVFLENVFTGVGPGQFYRFSFNKSSFSHNSYTEIAANLGIIGLILLIAILITPLINSISLYVKIKNPKFKNLMLLNIMFFTLFILYNNFYVFYTTTFGMIFFIVVVFIQKNTLNLVSFEE